MVEMSIIILSYNATEILLKCLESVFKSKTNKDSWQVIVVDNGSKDGLTEKVTKEYKDVKILRSRENLGFSKGNNLARRIVKSDYVLFLNNDTVVVGSAIQNTVGFLKSHPEAGAVTCRVELPDGGLDYSCHRGLPTPWNALCYFSGLAKLFPTVRLFSGYTATYLDLGKEHEVDCVTGAFLLIRRKALEEVGWWDEDYFWNGEDVELCFRLKEKGWSVYYYPDEKIIHHKGSTSGLWSTGLQKVSPQMRLMAARSGTQAMRIFWRKHFFDKYPQFLRQLVESGITYLEKKRLRKYV